MRNTAAARKRATNVTLSTALLDEARALGVNVSQACEQGLEQQVRSVRAAAWIEENREAIESSNAYVERHGLPLARYRLF